MFESAFDWLRRRLAGGSRQTARRQDAVVARTGHPFDDEIESAFARYGVDGWVVPPRWYHGPGTVGHEYIRGCIRVIDAAISSGFPTVRDSDNLSTVAWYTLDLDDDEGCAYTPAHRIIGLIISDPSDFPDFMADMDFDHATDMLIAFLGEAGESGLSDRMAADGWSVCLLPMAAAGATAIAGENPSAAAYGRALAGAWLDIYNRGGSSDLCRAFPDVDTFLEWRRALPAYRNPPQCVSTVDDMRAVCSGDGFICERLVAAIKSEAEPDYAALLRWADGHDRLRFNGYASTEDMDAVFRDCRSDAEVMGVAGSIDVLNTAKLDPPMLRSRICRRANGMLRLNQVGNRYLFFSSRELRALIGCLDMGLPADMAVERMRIEDGMEDA